jgi:hypothetical protein
MEKNKASRIEKIHEETKRAIEFGLQAPSTIPLGNNFRTEGLAAIPYSHNYLTVPGGEATFNHQGNKAGILLTKEPYLVQTNPKALIELIKYQLEAINDHNHGEIAPELLKSFAELSSQVRDQKTIAALHKEVLSKVFGANYFTQGGEAKAKRDQKK